MNTHLTLPRLHGPGLDWLPAVWRRGATWRTVARFGLWGPLVGGAPYNLFLIPIPFSYVIGGLPALAAGWLFATWYHAVSVRTPGALWRAVMGALCGLAAAGAAWLGMAVADEHSATATALIVAVHGVPAAIVLALVQRPPKDAQAS